MAKYLEGKRNGMTDRISKINDGRMRAFKLSILEITMRTMSQMKKTLQVLSKVKEILFKKSGRSVVSKIISMIVVKIAPKFMLL